MSADYLTRNTYTFRRLFVANREFRGALNILTFEWHTAKFNNIFVGPSKISYSITEEDFSTREGFISFVEEHIKKRQHTLDEMKLIQRKFLEDSIKSLLCNFHFNDQWFNTLVDFIIFRALFPPMGNAGIKRKISEKSLLALSDFEKFNDAKYFPKTEESLANYRRNKTINKNKNLFDILAIDFEVASKKKKSVDVTKEILKNRIGSFRKAGYKKLPWAKIEFKYELSDADAVLKLHPEFAHSPKKVKKEMLRMEQLRIRLDKLP